MRKLKANSRKGRIAHAYPARNSLSPWTAQKSKIMGAVPIFKNIF